MPIPPYLDLMRPRPTGHVLVTFRDGVADEQMAAIERVSVHGAGLAPARSVSIFEAAEIDPDILDGPVLVRGLGVGLVPIADRGAVGSVSRAIAKDPAVEEARPEFFMYSADAPCLAVDDAARTWGIAATGADRSMATGAGIRIAILDTGFALGHPDFVGKQITARSFVAGETAQDVQGHGTHCGGTAAGPDARGNVPRYGVATGADLVIGKVLNDTGSGREIDILAGMAWAIEEGCEVISMSLGRPTQPGELPSAAYERLGRRALERGCLIVAAAGNESARDFGYIAPVGAPANSPSILAVAAIAPTGAVADFSCGGIDAGGGEVDLAAPGVGIFSSVPAPRLYASQQGTSMACPHVAGIAALLAEVDPTLRGERLWQALVRSARDLGLSARDGGAGLVQAPGIEKEVCDGPSVAVS
ncbi:subtilase family protein [Palleronia aestuarii]|uniref:Subtilase family protein n=1 Tax=Palleronia aestuarii TaxID=568105 RepID=A0A2W7NBJ4_9RHOB|nr:S8 family serine peptidase [Palleronia aestuarii]PZX17795.1 subtilase family protein [Palleronia aestuarii]